MAASDTCRNQEVTSILNLKNGPHILYYKIRKCHHLFLELLNASHAVLELRREPDALLLDALLLRYLLLDSLSQLFLLVRLHRHISNVILK